MVGAWDPKLYTWPLIPVHAVLTPDMRIMSYGTDGIARQTGYFIYDLWDINAGLDGGHLTLDNVTSTDIFCGSQVVLPQGGQVFLAGGDNWTGTQTTNTGNNNSNVLDLSSSVLSRGNNMNRARWYSGSTVLLNGEVMIQGGSSGTDRPEVRAAQRHVPTAEQRRHQHARLHVSAQLHRARRPRVRLRQRRAHVLHQPDRHRHDHQRRPVRFGLSRRAMRARRCSARAASCSSAAIPTARW